MNMGSIHHCNFLENTADSDHTYIYFHFCTSSVYDCNFCNNYESKYLLFNEDSIINSYELTYQFDRHYIYTNNEITIGILLDNNNLHLHYCATRCFYAADIPIYTPTETLTPSPINTPFNTPLPTPFTTP